MKKVWQKVAIGKFATFLTPFQASSTKICLQVKSSHCMDEKCVVLNLRPMYYFKDTKEEFTRIYIFEGFVGSNSFIKFVIKLSLY